MNIITVPPTFKLIPLVLHNPVRAMAQHVVAQPEQQQPLTLQEGFIQSCQGYMERKSKYLKRWKRRWFAVEPGMSQLVNAVHSSVTDDH